ncbi:protein Wnt-7b-like [Tachypleus tridentatus]|uniref:protein Wnt-7b-like n=1 Tax=Tachypleus tridentatus TaxID=6853 RepID=UPI003FD362F9
MSESFEIIERLDIMIRMVRGGDTRSVPSAVAFSSRLLCDKIPGLTLGQRRICYREPDLLVAIGDGVRMGIRECQRQFKDHRWNCTNIGSDSVFGHVVVVGSREAAYIYAISSAGVTYAVTDACSRGTIRQCGCDESKKSVSSRDDWKWGGCSADVRYGTRISRKFMNSREIEKDSRSLMNLHNNKAGRKAVKRNMLTDCKCHGVSGSCTIRTCWKTLSSFARIGDFLMKKYHTAKKVLPFWNQKARPSMPTHLRVRISNQPNYKPRSRDLVYLQRSPNYCEINLSLGSPGTKGRRCNQTSNEIGGCALMCCGRGYNTHQLKRIWQCNCKFQWCCDVKCNMCSEKLEVYTCK